MHGPRKIVSGAQTGVDLAALDAALAAGIEIGGWVPRGRANEAGPIPATYQGLVEADSADPAARTALNVRDSDATLILTRDGARSPGTRLTVARARAEGRPHLVVAFQDDPLAATGEIRRWLAEARPDTLNVAGPRGSQAPGIGADVRRLLDVVLDGATRRRGG